ncbi:AAA family ATPase [Pseudoalteromonas piratica]|uniref:ATPase AAA n=1 Tax=Pseudoalteromonas piratica TaxID=1348114 RepID=A0A0A7EK05_9GAMM|nr:MoxR family ATPase [Pseudoalteromonas piratica]AIY66883.1 ATPase AAA [Pseudoalteromonas piratica]
MQTRTQINELTTAISNNIIGQEKVVERLIIGLLAAGNLLIEGLPGLAKTRAIKALSKHIDGHFSRIQFTPDLLPSDITGSEVFYQTPTGGEFKFDKGPLFANIVLADEINRAPAKVQSALLEAMEEKQITVAGTTHKMAPLFMVLATQNPVEQEGTYPLPEAQMDRFLMHVMIDYPAVEDEVSVIELVRQEEQMLSDTSQKQHNTQPIKIAQDVIFSARQEIANIKVIPEMARYMADLVYATRTPNRYDDELASWIDIGASPRASISLDKCARSYAWLQGREHVLPEDIRTIAHDVLRHRITLSYQAQGLGLRADDIIDRIISLVALP